MLTKLVLPDEFSLLNSSCFVSKDSIAFVDATGTLALGSIEGKSFKISQRIRKVGSLNLEQPVAIDRIGEELVVSDWLNYRVCFMSLSGEKTSIVGVPALSKCAIKNAKLGSSTKNIITCHRTGASRRVAMNNSRFKKFIYFLYTAIPRRTVGFKKINGVCSLKGALFFSDKNAMSVLRYHNGHLMTKFLGERLGNVKMYLDYIYICLEAQRKILVLDFDLNIVRTMNTEGRPFTLAFHKTALFYGGLDGLFRVANYQEVNLTEVIIKPLTDVHGIDILGDKILVTDRSTGLYLDSL